jgi:hypothetical protein
MIYTIQLTVKVTVDSENYAYKVVRHALNNARLAEIVFDDMEVIKTESEHNDDEPELPL